MPEKAKDDGSIAAALTEAMVTVNELKLMIVGKALKVFEERRGTLSTGMSELMRIVVPRLIKSDFAGITMKIKHQIAESEDKNNPEICVGILNELENEMERIYVALYLKEELSRGKIDLPPTTLKALFESIGENKLMDLCFQKAFNLLGNLIGGAEKVRSGLTDVFYGELVDAEQSGNMRHDFNTKILIVADSLEAIKTNFEKHQYQKAVLGLKSVAREMREINNIIFGTRMLISKIEQDIAENSDNAKHQPGEIGTTKVFLDEDSASPVLPEKDIVSLENLAKETSSLLEECFSKD